MSENNKFVYNVEIDTMEDAKAMVSTATKLKGKIVLRSGSKFSVNAKSLLGVLSLGIVKGTKIVLTADGADEKEAIDELEALIMSSFADIE